MDILKVRQTLGKNIRTYRLAKGLTQKKLSEITGINYKVISKIERGKASVSIEALIKISHATSTSLNFLIGGCIENTYEQDIVECLNIIKKLSPKNQRKASEIINKFVCLEYFYSSEK